MNQRDFHQRYHRAMLPLKIFAISVTAWVFAELIWLPDPEPRRLLPILGLYGSIIAIVWVLGEMKLKSVREQIEQEMKSGADPRK